LCQAKKGFYYKAFVILFNKNSFGNIFPKRKMMIIKLKDNSFFMDRKLKIK